MKLEGDFPTVLFSIEIATRELDSKLVMASVLAGLGCRAIVGHKEAISAIGRNSKGVVYLGKSVFKNRSDNQLANRLLQNGSAVIFDHDEGGVWPSPTWADGLFEVYEVESLVPCDVARVCLWGERQKAVLSARFPKLEKITTVTGSARFDVCAPSFAWLTQSQTGPKDCEPYILFCSRFCTAHAKGQAEPLFLAESNRPKADLRLAVDPVFESWRHEMHDFAEFIILIKELAIAFPGHTMVVRPHPTESIAFFEQAFAAFPNVVVRRDESVLAWIRSADLVVHSNCTTGIEAVLAGKAVVNFKPDRNDRSKSDVEVAREAGIAVGSISDALREAQHLLSRGTMSPSWSEDAKSTLNNLKADAIPLIAKTVMEVLHESHIDASKIVLPKAKALQNVLRPLVRNSRVAPYVDALRSLVQRKPPNSYIISKRGRISAEHVEKVVHGCGQQGIGGGRIRQCTEEYAVIEPS